MFKTLELGPTLNFPAPDFTLRDHTDRWRKRGEFVGRHGLLLGFVGPIWQAASVHRILWLQRHAAAISRAQCNVALLVHDQPHLLYGFYVSAPVPVPFPLLADEDGSIHRSYNMTHPGMVLLDRRCTIREKWLMPDERIWPKTRELIGAIEMLLNSSAG